MVQAEDVVRRINMALKAVENYLLRTSQDESLLKLLKSSLGERILKSN